MALRNPKPSLDERGPFSALDGRPRGQSAFSGASNNLPNEVHPAAKPSEPGALQQLLAFAALQEWVQCRQALASQHEGFDARLRVVESEEAEQFVLDEVLHLISERALAITGAAGLAIALAEKNEIVLRAAAGTVRPDVGARIDRDSTFSGACLRTAQIVTCDDTETDPRVNLQACRELGARSMVAVPLCGRRSVIGLLEAFSDWPFRFSDKDVRNLRRLAELVLGGLKPEEEDLIAESAQIATTKLETDAPAKNSQTIGWPTDPTQVSWMLANASAVAAATKSTDAAVQFASAGAILDESVRDPLQVPALEESAGPQPAVSEARTQEQVSSIRRPGMRILLLCIVIVTAFAAGVLSKVRTKSSRIATARTDKVRTKKAATKPAEGGAKSNDNANASVHVGVNSAETSAVVNARPNVVSDAKQRISSSATPQELSQFPRIRGIEHSSSADSSTVVIDLEDQVQYEAQRLAAPNRIYFDLHNTQLAPDLTGKSIEVRDELLKRIRVAQPVPGTTRIVLETRAKPNFSVRLESAPYRLVVEVRKIAPDADAQ